MDTTPAPEKAEAAPAPPAYTASATAINRVCAILAESDDWTPTVPIQIRLGRNAMAIDAAEALGLIESRRVRLGARGRMRRMVRLTVAGKAVHATNVAGH